MTSADVVRRLHRHRQWVNRRLLEAVRPLSVEQLRKPLAIGQGSVWKTLAHLMAAEYVWLEALLGNESPLMPGDVPDKLPGNQEGEQAVRSLEELVERWTTLEQRWNDYLLSLQDEVLEQPVVKISTSSRFGKRCATSRLDVLLHVCTHAQYTTAQLVNMLRQLEQPTLPDVMLITLAREGLPSR